MTLEKIKKLQRTNFVKGYNSFSALRLTDDLFGKTSLYVAANAFLRSNLKFGPSLVEYLQRNENNIRHIKITHTILV